ncbi:N-acetylgalactosamine-6-sulfatase [Aureibaculum marinum]|uniref:N-acetylgalactosamine-6-sulfatase n=1 Tax=Aureibaculum marinum TaxID=2487930 RepID=A0A3N4NUC2_9FLAO|nr:arylsulfatase [Aureibaculum marinum]RPD99972.1 N-acetylgalactosamine-6-sulfatase [Aureibaculum marinum]
MRINTINKIFYLSVILLFFFSSCVEKQTLYEEVKGSKPNIIYIMADDLGYGDLGCYGQDSIETPNIDKLASEGLLFTQHYAGSTVCAPSRNSLMTGQHIGNTTIKSMEKPIKKNDITVAEVLKSAGYSTAIIGKWGLGNVGTTGYANDKGFDYSFGYYDQIRAHNYYPDYLMENGKKISLKNEVIYIKDSTHYAVGIGNAATKKIEYSNDIFTDKALTYLDEQGSKPFFLYLPYTIPHGDNESWLIKQHGMEVPDLGDYADKNWPEAKKAGAAMISRLDSYVGQIMTKLKDKGLDENTLVIFTSDNGPHQEGGWKLSFFNSNGVLKGMKRDLYEGGIRIPFIARWPNKIKQNTTTNTVATFWDFMATASELAGVPLPSSSDGISYLPTLIADNKAQKKHDYLYWEFDTNLKRRAARKGSYKLITITDKKTDSTTIELFNIDKDITESKNIAADHPDIVKDLQSVINQFKKN